MEMIIVVAGSLFVALMVFLYIYTMEDEDDK